MKISFPIWVSILTGIFILSSCGVETATTTGSAQVVSTSIPPTITTSGLVTAVPTQQLSPINEPVAQAMPPTITSMSPAMVIATPLLTTPLATTALATTALATTPLATTPPTPTATATPIGPCVDRNPTDDLFTIVTQTYGLSRDFSPADLALLTDYLPIDVTLGYPTELRQVALLPLQQLIADMQGAGLQPRIYSGYRSYAAQAISWEKWNREEPERAAILSARPGHSEHQLGTTIDFGSPELAEITGIADIRFHTYFYRTSEGSWLAENAYRYGFTLSYPRGALEITGFFYEPWHYRYVGVEMATFLHETGFYLTEYQLLNQPEPCIP